MITLVVKIPNSLDKKLQEFCEIDRRSKSWFVKKALQAYLEDLEDEALAQLAMKAHEEGYIGVEASAKTYGEMEGNIIAQTALQFQ